MHPLETYLTELRDIRSTGAAVAETSYYTPLANLLNEIGKTLKPKVRCVINIANRGAGLPDAGLFTADQIRKNDPNPMQGQIPARGVVEVKGPGEDVEKIARSEQVERYAAKYGLVLVTNYRDFLLVMRDATQEKPSPTERYTLAASEAAFWQCASHPVKTAEEHGARFCEYLTRVMLTHAPLSAPEDLAWFLASYARDAKARVESHKDLDALNAVRAALEEALGMKFTGDKGEHFFRSTLVQTIFYGIFSAWVLWHREAPKRTDAFDWRLSAYLLRVPFIRALYDQIATPRQLGHLDLVEVLDWTAAALNRVDRVAFFQKFESEHAVLYFYEPFLQSFDPELRKELGVWLTPPEIVQYQVARVDAVLRTELGLADGLADPSVIVLDPCCGTATYLLYVLKKIADTLRAKGGDALIASDLKKAAMTRVFGFEILPAPFVVSHLQLGLLLHDLGAPLSPKGDERVGVYLTNSLTGWEPPKEPKQTVLGFMEELQKEKDAAEHVKRGEKVLVILGNPPYNAFAGVSPEEEQGLVEPYKLGLKEWGITKNYLDDLYVRFFRLGERRIAEMTGKGVVSFISNYSWLSDQSYVVLRRHLLDSFDRFWIESLHGDRKISEYAPDGRTSETIFAQRGFSVGIRQGVATSLWVKTGKPRKAGQAAQVLFRDDIDSAKAQDRRRRLLSTLTARTFDAAYKNATPSRENRYSFRPEEVSAEYSSWPKLPDLSLKPPFLGLNENRGGALQEIDRERISSRMRTYLDREVSWGEYQKLERALTQEASGFAPQVVREKAQRNEPYSETRIRRYVRRPFDLVWAYVSDVSPVWNRSRPELRVHLALGQPCLVTRPACPATPEGVPFLVTKLAGEQDMIRGHAYYFPTILAPPGKGKSQTGNSQASLLETHATANLSPAAGGYLASLGIKDLDSNADVAGLIWFHALAIGYSPAYLSENADGIRRDWPRIPLPDTRKALEASAALGRQVAAILGTQADVPGVTSGAVRPIFRTMAVLTKVGGGALDPDAGELALTAGWGHAGKEGVTMPGKGRIVERPNDKTETSAIADTAKAQGLSQRQVLSLLGQSTRDVYLNDNAYWKNVPAAVWDYYIGGYQVIKKWLSYREQELLGRPLRAEEAREVTGMARRLAAIVLLQPAFDANYKAVKSATYNWPKPA